MLNFIKDHNSYYSKYLSEVRINLDNSVEVLKTLPLLDKELIRELGSTIYSDFVGQKYKSWHNTGGSTGAPLKFPIGNNYGRLRANPGCTCQLQLYRMMGGSCNSKISSIDGSRNSTELLNKNIFWKIQDEFFPYGRIHYSTIYLIVIIGFCLFIVSFINFKFRFVLTFLICVPIYLLVAYYFSFTENEKMKIQDLSDSVLNKIRKNKG